MYHRRRRNGVETHNADGATGDDAAAESGSPGMEKGPDGCEQDPMRRAAGGLLRAAAVSLVAVAMGPVASALAEPPHITITSPVNGSISNDRTPTFRGSTDEPLGEVTVKVYAGAGVGGSVEETLTASLPASEWSAESTKALADGVYTAQASQTNVLTEEGTSGPVTFVVDTSSPIVTLNPLTSPSNNTTPSFSGFASDTSPVTVEIYLGETTGESPVSSATATNTGGDWNSDQANPSLASGRYTAVATQESSLGNESGKSSPVRFTVDTSAPKVTLQRPETPSNNTTPTFTGTASDPTEPVTVEIVSTTTGKPVASAAASGTGGGWTSGQASPALASGEYTATATQKSSLGNELGTSLSVTFTVSTASPTVTLQQPQTPSNNTKPTFNGTASDTRQIVVHIYNAANSEVSSATASGTGGGWTTNNESGLPSGSYTAVATQESSLGNEPGESSPVSFTVETASPRVTLNSPAIRSNNTTPTFTGTASDPTEPVTVEISSKTTGKVVAKATASGTGGSWTSGQASPALTNGEYTATATQESSLHNGPGVSSPVTFSVNTASPTVTLQQPQTPSNHTTPTFTGTASDPTEPVTVEISSKATGKVVAKATASGTGGSWTSGQATPALASGEYTATATQKSSFGNEPGTSAPVNFTVSTASPKVALQQPKTPSNNTTPTFTGTASDPTEPVTVEISSKTTGKVVAKATASGTGGSWTSGQATPALASGEYTATATQKSSLGNEPGTSAPVNFTVSTASPKVALQQPKTPSNNTTPSFTGTASDTTPVIVRMFNEENNEVSSTEGKSPNARGEWSSGKLSSALSSGKHTYTAEAVQTSSLGNLPGVSSRVTFQVDTTAPVVTLNPPVSHSNNARPSFTGTTSDTTPVTVAVYLGTKTTGAKPLTTVKATPSGGVWASGTVTLPEGKNIFTAVASQPSSLGNAPGTSGPAQFAVDTSAPSVTLNAPAAATNNTTPSFTGTASENSPVTIEIYAGSTISGNPVSKATAAGTRGGWISGPANPALPDGQYTARASQGSEFGHEPGESERPVSFTVDTAAPHVTLTSPPGGNSTVGTSQLVSGSAGTASGDLPGVTVQLFAGSGITSGQVPVQSIGVTAAQGAWSATFAGLSPGTYTVRAEQADAAGNLGVSNETTFSVVGSAAPAGAAGPSPSFSWAPTTPHVGEKISLLSSSTDAASPITGYAWDLAGNGAFAVGGAVNSTSFSTPGKHLVQLLVTDAKGASSVAAETILVGARVLPLMRPFPTVRITGTRSGSAIRLKLLSVRAPAGARVSVKCTGHGCPLKSQSRVAAAGKVGVAPMEFRRFQRSLRAGVVLEIRVSKAGEIGKYTRFAVRRHKLPARTDACLGPAAGNPIACPTS